MALNVIFTLLGLLAAQSASAWRPAAILGPRWNSLIGLPSDKKQREQTPRQGYTREAEADAVPKLPGLQDGTVPFGLYGGYITVNEDNGRALYYTLAESQTNALEHPLVLWLNGGPGCSSIGGGFLSELGPFYPTPGGDRLQLNPHAWNKDANILFIESPAFVGFSYSNTSSDIAAGDWRTARDLVVFLQRFMDRFPVYRGRPFWISGESYGGHYVPNLAAALLDAEKGETDRVRAINLQGFLVGNAWTDAAIDNHGTIDFWWYHGLIPDETHSGLLKHCDMSHVGPLYVTNDSRPEAEAAGLVDGKLETSAQCQDLLDQVPIQMGQINIYDIYVKHAAPARQLAKYLAGTAAGTAAAATARAPLNAARSGLRSKYDPCIDNEVVAFLNRRDVQRALNVPTPARPNPAYEVCNSQIAYNISDVFTSMLPVYKRLLDAKLKMLVFSGDIDGIVPLVGTRRWIDSLCLPVTHAWRPYYTESGQVGGRVVEYEGLSFATVRAAGHMVPYTQPERAAWLFRHWIHDKPL